MQVGESTNVRRVQRPGGPIKHLTKSSLPEIGREFGGKHHTTVIHSVNKITDLYEREADFHRLINSLISSLK